MNLFRVKLPSESYWRTESETEGVRGRRRAASGPPLSRVERCVIALSETPHLGRVGAIAAVVAEDGRETDCEEGIAKSRSRS